jgi:hypothetical protein
MDACLQLHGLAINVLLFRALAWRGEQKSFPYIVVGVFTVLLSELLRNLATDCLPRICLRGDLFTNPLPGNALTCLLADNVRNEVVTIHRSLKVLKMLFVYTYIGHQLSLNGGHRGLDVDSVNFSCDSFAYLRIPGSESTLHQKIMSTADRSHLLRQTVETNCKHEPW